jgi:hypothetical protein
LENLLERMTLGSGLHGATFAEMRTEFKFASSLKCIVGCLGKFLRLSTLVALVHWLSSGLRYEESFESWQGQ